MLHEIKVRHKCNAISGVIHLCGDGMLIMANRPMSYILGRMHKNKQMLASNCSKVKEKAKSNYLEVKGIASFNMYNLFLLLASRCFCMQVKATKGAFTLASFLV